MWKIIHNIIHEQYVLTITYNITIKTSFHYLTGSHLIDLMWLILDLKLSHQHSIYSKSMLFVSYKIYYYLLQYLQFYVNVYPFQRVNMTFNNTDKQQSLLTANKWHILNIMSSNILIVQGVFINIFAFFNYYLKFSCQGDFFSVNTIV